MMAALAYEPPRPHCWSVLRLGLQQEVVVEQTKVTVEQQKEQEEAAEVVLGSADGEIVGLRARFLAARAWRPWRRNTALISTA